MWKIKQDGKIVDSGECGHVRITGHFGCLEQVLGCKLVKSYLMLKCTKENCPIKEDDDKMKYTPEERKRIREAAGLSIKEVHDKANLGPNVDWYKTAETPFADWLVESYVERYDAFLAGLEKNKEPEKEEPVISREFVEKNNICNWDILVAKDEDVVTMSRFLGCVWNKPSILHLLMKHDAITTELQLTRKSLVIEKPEIKVGDMVVDTIGHRIGVVTQSVNHLYEVEFTDGKKFGGEKHLIPKQLVINPRKFTYEGGKITVDE